MIWPSFRPRLERGDAIPILLVLALVAGCSEDDAFPECENCEDWTPITAGLARFPEPHPLRGEWVAFSTIAKTPGAPDENRDSDEDIWLVRIVPGAAPPTSNPAYSPANNPTYQLTGEGAFASGDNLGDNFGPRWNPSGNQIAFLHATRSGGFEVWRVAVTLPDGDGEPVVATPELVARDGRDPEWETDTRIYFTRADKIFRVDLPAGPGPPLGPPEQLTFDPPSYSSSESYRDRHPDFARDDGAVFDTRGRRNVAELFVQAFEIDDTVAPSDTFATAAFISFFPPGATSPSYPIFEGPDTLTTPVLLQSLPVDAGGNFLVGVRRDSRFLADSTAETYCDTLLTQVANLAPGDADTLSFYFKISRGTLRLRSDLNNTLVSWTRQDGRVTVDDFPGSPLITDPTEVLQYDCLLSYRVVGGVVDESALETYLVTGTRGTRSDTVSVEIPPGGIVTANLFPSGHISGQLAYSDGNPSPPLVTITVLEAGTTNEFTVATSDETGRGFITPLVPDGSYDLIFNAVGYLEARLDGVPVQAPKDTFVGTVTLTRAPGAKGEAQLAFESNPGLVAERGDLRRGRTVFRQLDSRRDNPAQLRAIFRAPGDASALWRIDVSGARARFTEIFGSRDGFIQNPALTEDFGNGVRYVAYVSDESGDWELYVQRLVNWAPDGSPQRVATPGTFDNLSCSRSVFQPRWLPGPSETSLRLVVAMTDCPDNGFEDLGIDDDPWALGELRLWEVTIR
jgi:hypothetical protein